MNNITSTLISVNAKKLLSFILTALVVCFFASSGQCLAMQMSQPVKIGETRADMVIGGVTVQGASYVSKENIIKNRRCVEMGGNAKFGTGNDALWMHHLYDISGEYFRVAFGSKDINNTFYIGRSPSIEGCGVPIFKISTDLGVTLYAIGSFSDSHLDWIILGYRDGKFVKYIDTYKITKQYINRAFNYCGNFYKVYSGNPFEIQGDTIIMNYSTGSRNDAFPSEVSGAKMLTIGQFRFKWDDAAKWFGVKYDSFI